MVYAGHVSEDLLAWNSKEGRRFNPLALTETLWGVGKLFEELAKQFDRPVSEFRLSLFLGNMLKDNQPTLLPPHGLGTYSFEWGDHDKAAPEDEFSTSYSLTMETVDAEHIAYFAARLIYLWFGFTEDNIPYTEQRDSYKVITKEKILEYLRRKKR